MIIEKICICSISSENGYVYDIWINTTEHHAEEVVFFNGKLGGNYLMSLIFHFALIGSDDDKFTLSKNYDDDEEISFSVDEIKRLAKSILTSIPVKIGALKISVKFEHCDPRVPF